MQSGEHQKIKVCYIVTKGVWGGAGKYVYSLATHLPREVYESLVICGEGEELPKKLANADIKTFQLPKLRRDISFFAEFWSSLSLLRIVWKEKPDILHLNSPKASGFGAVAGRLSGVKQIIYTVHGFAFNENRNVFSKALIWFFSWITIMLCHKTVVLSEKEKRQALAMPFVGEKKVVLIHSGVENIHFKEKDTARVELRQKISKQIPEEALWIGTLSELHKNKGLEYAIFALSKIRFPFVFFILGKGEERENLERLIIENNLIGKVFLLGFVEHANEYLFAFDIFTLTSVKEGLPYAMLEAGLASLPVIASRVGGIPDIVDTESGILVAKEKPHDIARALEYLKENPDKRKVFGENLKAKVKKDFSLAHMLENTFKLYQ